MTATFDFRLLGPVEVRRGEQPVPLGSVRQRALLAVLLLSANEVVPTERLIDDLWGPHPPLTAKQSLHNHVSALRKLLDLGQAPAMLRTRDPGYLIEIEEERLDVAASAAWPGAGPRGWRPATPRPPWSCSARRSRCGAAPRWPT